MKLDFTNFKPLPERKYDLNRYESYPHYVANCERKEIPRWRCFAIFSPSLISLIMEMLQDYKESECYIHDIFDDTDNEEEIIN